MRRKNSGPFLRGQRGIYYCWVEGNLRSLKTDKPKVAKSRYQQLLTDWERQKKEAARRKEEAERPKVWTVRECLDYYLAAAEGMKPNTHRNRKQTFDRFCKEAGVGTLRWHELTVEHLESWLDRHADWSASMRRSVINYVLAAFNHCVRRRKVTNVTENPLEGITKPRWERRREAISTDDERKVYEASKGPFRAILTALRETGARPSELCNARVEHYRDGVIVLDEHKTDETGGERTIYLNANVRALVERLIGVRTTGHIFRNARDDPWTPDTLYCRFKRLRKKLGLGDGVFPYSLRSKFTSDAINNANANPALIAKSLGHSDLNMLLKHYLREDPEAVRRALEEVTGERKARKATR